MRFHVPWLVPLAALVWAGCPAIHVRPGSPAGLSAAPAFELPAHIGDTVALNDLVSAQPAPVVSCRGHW